MRRRKTKRLTRPKKSKKSVLLTPYTPTDEEWATMMPFGSFQVYDEDGAPHTFRVQDFALIRPQGDNGADIEDHENWLARIKDIRARSDLTDVWARVQWYWSGEEVAAVVKSFDASSCARYERIFSDVYDYVPSTCFNGVVTMKRYRETDPDQADIADNEFFCRYTLEYELRAVDPKPLASCLCQVAYNPDDELIMHFCPRCFKAYHRHCLLEAASLDFDSNRKFRLISCSPATTANTTYPIANLDDPKSSRKKRNRCGRTPSMANFRRLISAFPNELLELAKQSIVKGGKDGTIVGNIKSVIGARRMVCEAINGPATLPDDWRRLLDLKPASKTCTEQDVPPPLLCPECGSPI